MSTKKTVGGHNHLTVNSFPSAQLDGSIYRGSELIAYITDNAYFFLWIWQFYKMETEEISYKDHSVSVSEKKFLEIEADFDNHWPT